MPERLLSVKEAAEITGYTVATWRAWISRRKVSHHRFGRTIRIAQSDLTRMIKDARVPATTDMTNA
jgi:excisionase family DNA binding protein